MIHLIEDDELLKEYLPFDEILLERTVQIILLGIGIHNQTNLVKLILPITHSVKRIKSIKNLRKESEWNFKWIVELINSS